MTGELPILQAFLLADHVYTDATTGKRVIAGTFNRIISSSFPTHYPPVAVFVQLTELSGKSILQFKLVRLSDNFVVMESGEIPIESNDKLAVTNISVAVPSLPFAKPGMYGFECYVGGDLVGTIRLFADIAKEDITNEND